MKAKNRPWYARETTWPGKVHRSKKVMARVARLLAAKRERDEKLSTPAARAARRRALDAHRKRVRKLKEQRVRIVDLFTAETDAAA